MCIAAVAGVAEALVLVMVFTIVLAVTCNKAVVTSGPVSTSEVRVTDFQKEPVATAINVTADISVTSTDPGLANVGDNVTYAITVHNAGPYVAENVTLTVCLSARLLDAKYSTDNGTTGLDWIGLDR